MHTPKQVRIILRRDSSLAWEFFSEAVYNGQTRIAQRIFLLYYVEKGVVDMPNINKFCLAAVRNGHRRILKWLIQYGPQNYNKLYVAAMRTNNAKLKQFLMDYNTFMIGATFGTSTSRLHPGLYMAPIFNSIGVILKFSAFFPGFVTKLVHYLIKSGNIKHLLWVTHNIPLISLNVRAILEYCILHPVTTKQLIRSIINHLPDLDYDEFYMSLCDCGSLKMIEYIDLVRRPKNYLDIIVHIIVICRYDVLDHVLKQVVLSDSDHNIILNLVGNNDLVEVGEVLIANGFNIIICAGHIIKWVKK